MPDAFNDLSGIEAINRKKFSLAQELFRRDVRNNPCHKTYANLGVYYACFGMELSNGRHCSALKKAYRLLLKAIAMEDNAISLEGAGSILLQIPHSENNLHQAYSFLVKAESLRPNPITKYNVGVCLFYQRKYQDAINTFSELTAATDIEIICHNQGYPPNLSKAICFWLLNDYTNCLKQISQIEHEYKLIYRPWIFLLLVFCRQFEDAVAEFDELKAEWAVTPGLLAALSECFQQLPNLRDHIESLVGDVMLYPENPFAWKRLKIDRKYRKKVLSREKFTLPIIEQYQFIQ